MTAPRPHTNRDPYRPVIVTVGEDTLMRSLAAMGVGAARSNAAARRDCAVAGRAMDTLAAMLGVETYTQSTATCADAKCADEIGAILRAAGLQSGPDGIYKLLV